MVIKIWNVYQHSFNQKGFKGQHNVHKNLNGNYFSILKQITESLMTTKAKDRNSTLNTRSMTDLP